MNMKRTAFAGTALLVVAILVAALILALPGSMAETRTGPVAFSVQAIKELGPGRPWPNLVAPRQEVVELKLRELGVISPDTSIGEVDKAVQDWFRVFDARKRRSGPNPLAYRLRKQIWDRALAQDTNPKDLGETLQAEARQLLLLVEFTGTQTFTHEVWDPEIEECVVVTNTIAGPLHNGVSQPGPLDNNTIWYEDDTPELYEALIFGTGPSAGVGVVRTDLNGGAGVDLTGLTAANWYLEQSEEAYLLTGEATAWVKLPVSEGEYGADSCDDNDDLNGPVWRVAVDAADALNTTVPGFPWADFDLEDPGDLDGDGVTDEPDGIVDHLMIIHAGAGQEAGGGAEGDYAVWSHSWDVDWPNGHVVDDGGTPADPSDDIRVLNYTIIPENVDVGVVVHEYGHDIGLPDVYSFDASNSTGFWNVMSSGSWNGPLGGAQPAAFDLWSKVFFGWAAPVALDLSSPDTEVVVGQTAQRPAGTEYGIWVNLTDQEEMVPNPLGTGQAWYSGRDNRLYNTLSQTFDLTGAATPLILSFDAYWEIEEDWDYGYVEVSTDGGATWTTLPDMDGILTNTNPHGNNLGWGLTGFGSDTLSFDFSAYAGSVIDMRFSYVTDAAVTELGLFVDNIALDTVFADDVEAPPDGWTVDGWLVVPLTLTFPHYYLAEWHNYSGFDEGLQYAYFTTYVDDDEWQVQRTPYSAPGMLLYYRNEKYSWNYFIDPTLFDPPSIGAKGGLLVVDAHPAPRIFPSGLTLGGRTQTQDSTFSLSDSVAFSLTDPRTGELADFAPRSAVSAFNDYMGFYPGLWCCTAQGRLVFWDWDGSVVVPARDFYSTKITDSGGNPYTPLYDFTVLGYPLGDGNPWEQAYGVNLTIAEQASDGSWGRVQVTMREPTVTEVAIVAAPNATGNVVSTRVLENNFGGGPLYTGADTRGRRPVIYHGAVQFDLSAIPADAHIISAQVELTGLTDQFLGEMVNGTWDLWLLEDILDATWTGLGYWHISQADTLARIGPTLDEDDLGISTVNLFSFSPYEVTLLADRVATTGKASFRLDSTADRAGRRHIFAWDGGRGTAGVGSAPVLRVTYFQPQ